MDLGSGQQDSGDRQVHLGRSSLKRNGPVGWQGTTVVRPQGFVGGWELSTATQSWKGGYKSPGSSLHVAGEETKSGCSAKVLAKSEQKQGGPELPTLSLGAPQLCVVTCSLKFH